MCNIMVVSHRIFEVQWDGSDSEGKRPAAKRRLPIFERTAKPSPTAAHKTRKKWSEKQEKTLLEGVEKYVFFHSSMHSWFGFAV